MCCRCCQSKYTSCTEQSNMHAFLNAGGPYHSREWCSSVYLHFCSSSKTVFSFSGGPGFCSMTPVTAHPFCEVTVIILIIIHIESRQEPERHDGIVQGASWCSKSPYNWCKVWSQSSGTEGNDDADWPTKPLTGWLYYTTLSHKAKQTCFKSLWSLKYCCCSCILGWSQNKLQSFCSSL